MKKLSRNEVEKMGMDELMALAREELKLKAMRESLLSTGSVLPALERMQMLPMEAPAAVTQTDVRPASIPTKVKKQRLTLLKRNKRDKWTAIENTGGEIDWTKIQKICPRCETAKVVDPDFGLRKAKEGTRPHSWCKACRGRKDYGSY